jgi:hypothetical protein
MDIHKPKPWHGLREFLKEYLIVVVGVLTALGAEQVAEWLHWRHEVEVQREALLSETRDNMGAATYRVSRSACVSDRLTELGEVFRRQARGLPLGLKRRIGRPALWIATTGSWDIAVSGQALAHMPQAEKLAFSNAFDTYRAWSRLKTEEDQVWGRLGLLNQSDLLPPGAWPALYQDYAEAVFLNERTTGTGKYLLREAALGQIASQPDRASVSAAWNRFCQPLI